MEPIHELADAASSALGGARGVWGRLVSQIPSGGGLVGWFVGTWLGNLALGALTFLGIFAVFALHFEKKGAAHERAKAQHHAEILNEKGREAFRDALAPGSAVRLRQRWCRDC